MIEERKQLSKTVWIDSSFLRYGESIDEIVATLKGIEAEYGPGKLDIDVDYEGDIDMSYSYHVMETQKQADARAKRREEAVLRRQSDKIKQEENAYARYLVLKDRFDPQNKKEKT